jgi:hypothetical protein
MDASKAVENLNIPDDEKNKIVALVFHIVDAVYGGSYHYIGDGDGIGDGDAKEIKKYLDKYSDKYWKIYNS